jgi:hypothetical protein
MTCYDVAGNPVSFRHQILLFRLSSKVTPKCRKRRRWHLLPQIWMSTRFVSILIAFLSRETKNWLASTEQKQRTRLLEILGARDGESISSDDLWPSIVDRVVKSLFPAILRSVLTGLARSSVSVHILQEWQPSGAFIPRRLLPLSYFFVNSAPVRRVLDRLRALMFSKESLRSRSVHILGLI